MFFVYVDIYKKALDVVERLIDETKSSGCRAARALLGRIALFGPLLSLALLGRIALESLSNFSRSRINLESISNRSRIALKSRSESAGCLHTLLGCLPTASTATCV